MGLVQRAGMTLHPPVPLGVYEKCCLDFLSGIKKKMKELSIPPDLMLNADQTPSNYVSTGVMTMVKKGEKKWQ